jgi:hypothetical protein
MLENMVGTVLLEFRGPKKVVAFENAEDIIL